MNIPAADGRIAGRKPAAPYGEPDHDSAEARIAAFADQVERRLAGEITEDQFRPLRLMNGVYLQRHSYMLRAALPYGMLSPGRLRMLAQVARKYDKGYGHFTTRRDIQFNWPGLADIPAILADLATVGMRAVQTSNNRIDIVAATRFAGAAADEVADPRPYAEMLRRWSCAHPEFLDLPRRIRIAVTGSDRDRAAIRAHDIGLRLKRDDRGQTGFGVHVGGRARMPLETAPIRDFLPAEHLLSYCAAILRVYGLHRRHSDSHRERLETLVHAVGTEDFARRVEAEWSAPKDGRPTPPEADIAAIHACFAQPALPARPEGDEAVKLARLDSRSFGEWLARNTVTHRQADYAAVAVPLTGIGETPGDISAEQMEAVADIAARYGFDEVHASREQELVLPHVARADLKAVHDALAAIGLTQTVRQDSEERPIDGRRAGSQPLREALHAREFRAA